MVWMVVHGFAFLCGPRCDPSQGGASACTGLGRHDTLAQQQYFGATAVTTILRWPPQRCWAARVEVKGEREGAWELSV